MFRFLRPTTSFPARVGAQPLTTWTTPRKTVLGLGSVAMIAAISGVASARGNEPGKLYIADFCPFAQRAWIAAEEVNAPVELVEVNYLNPDHPATQHFYTVNADKTVPACEHNGNTLSESLELSLYFDEAFPGKSLSGQEPIDKFKVRMAIKKHGGLVGGYYGCLMAQDKEVQRQKADLLIKDVENFGERIQGPYYFGEHYSMVDVAFFPFFERMAHVLAYYRGDVYSIPDTPAGRKVVAWYKAVGDRPAVKVTTADRSTLSLKTQPFEQRKREPYLREVYAAYAKNDIAGEKVYRRTLKAPLEK